MMRGRIGEALGGLAEDLAGKRGVDEVGNGTALRTVHSACGPRRQCPNEAERFERLQVRPNGPLVRAQLAREVSHDNLVRAPGGEVREERPRNVSAAHFGDLLDVCGRENGVEVAPAPGAAKPPRGGAKDDLRKSS